MQISKKELIKKLEAVKPGLAINKDIIEFSDSFCFTKKYITTFNDMVSVACPLESEDLIGTVKAEEFFKIINKIAPDKNGNLQITIEDEEIITKGKRSSSGIPFNEKGGLPLEEINQNIEKWNKLPSNFLEGIRLAGFCASNDASIPWLTCLHIKGSNISSTNSMRAFQFHMKSKIKSEILIPTAQANILLNYPITMYSFDDYWAHFKTKEGVIISCRIYTNENNDFPDLDSFFGKKGEKITLPAKIEEVMNRASIFCQGEAENEKYLQIQIQEKKWIVKSQTRDVGWFKEIIPHKSPISMNFEVILSFMQDIIKSTKEAQLVPSGELNWLQFNAEDWDHILLIDKNEE